MKKVLREVFDWVKTFVIIFILVTLVHKYVFTPVKVDGPSMYPTLHDEDSVILWKFGYQPKPFDVIVFEYSPDVYYARSFQKIIIWFLEIIVRIVVIAVILD